LKSIAPEHIGLVLDGVSPKFSVQIAESIQFLLDIPRVSWISVFLPSGDLPFQVSSPTIRVFYPSDVSRTFRELSEKDADYAYPFEKPLDLVIVYSRSSSLCNFFPWTMDLTTFVLAGPIVNLSPASIVDGIVKYSGTEQRLGK
jgi:hypothetical protein